MCNLAHNHRGLNMEQYSPETDLTFFDFGNAPKAKLAGFKSTGVEVHVTEDEAKRMFGRQENIGLVFGGIIGYTERKSYLVMLKPEKKNKYLITTIDEDYNEDSAVIETDHELDGLSSDTESLKAIIGDTFIIGNEDKVYITNLSKADVLVV